MSAYQHTHLPPNSSDLEAAVLGIALVEAKSLALVETILPEPEAFYVPRHQLIYRAMLQLARNGAAVDILTVTQQLTAVGQLQKAGGPAFVVELTTKVSAATNLESHCRILQQQYVRRVIINAARELERKGYDEGLDPLDLLAEAQSQLGRLTGSLESRSVKSAASIYDEVFDELALAVQQKGLTGVDTGLTELNDATGGFQRGSLVVLGARPGMGKSAAMLHFARTAALSNGLPSAVFSMEMPLRELFLRMVASEVEGYSNADLSRGRMAGGVEEVQDLRRKAQRLNSHLLLLDDTPGLSLQQLRAKCARLKAEQHIGLIMVDYLQLMHGDGHGKGNREQEIASISRGLKEMAKELNVPVVALAQLSRSVETRGGEKRPQLSDLRESGSIEQDADIIMFLWRGEYYNITEYEDGTQTAGTILLDLAKHRSGATGEIIAACNMRRGLFSDLDASPVPAGERPMYVEGETVRLGRLPVSTFNDQPSTTVMPTDDDPGF